MQFTFRIWKFSKTIIWIDINPTDGDISIGITISWKER